MPGAKIGVRVLTVVISIPVGIATRKVVERAWLAARPDNPARRPAEPGVKWADAVVWAAMSAAGLAVADLVARRSAEAAYEAITGNNPPKAG
ncbi:MAG TPA: DUF4235 domain-containing protein [Jatrophihabitans sp.]|nr:DUF4235 domain-containing protein [Jatrophihabitans sp.]